jgi:hypothetical protein
LPPGKRGAGGYAGCCDTNPVIGLVELSDDARAHIGAPIIKLLFDLVFDDGALFLDDQHLFEPFGKLPHHFSVQGPAHSEFEYPQADLGGERLVDTEIFQGLADIQIGFTGGDDAG